QRGLHLVHVDAQAGGAPHVRHDVGVARIDVGQAGQHVLVQAAPVRQPGLVQRRVQPRRDLALGERPRRREHHVVAGAAGGQLGLERLVLRIDVVVDLDPGRLLEAFDGVLGHIVGPVVDIELLAGLATRSAVTGTTATGGEQQGAGKRGKADRGWAHRGGSCTDWGPAGAPAAGAHGKPCAPGAHGTVGRARVSYAPPTPPDTPMRLAPSCLLLALAATPGLALAQEAADDGVWSVEGGVTAVSDFVWR